MKKHEKCKTEKDKEKKKTKLSSYKKIIFGLAGILVSAYPIVNIVYNALYQIKSEALYGIPGKYFHDSVDNRLMYLGCIVILMGMCAIPVIIKKHDEKSLGQKKVSNAYVYFLSIVLGVPVGVLNVDNWLAIMKHVYKKDSWFGNIVSFLSQNTYIMIFIIILGSMAVLGLTYNFQIIKSHFLKEFFIKMFAIAFALSFTLAIGGVVCRLSINLEDQTKYELVVIDKQSYAVLAEDDEKILAVPYIETKDEEFVFDTRKYYFFDKYQGTYQYVYMKNPPQIIK